ncbi:hypothetical protein MASR2M78_32160 [Treponema sp.]
MLDAIDKYDPDKNVKFKTYAVTRIRGAIFDELRSIDWVPRSVRQKTREIEETIGSLEAQLGRTVNDQEIAKALGLSIRARCSKAHVEISGTSILSLNDVWFAGDDNDRISMGVGLDMPHRVLIQTLSLKKKKYDASSLNLSMIYPKKKKKYSFCITTKT